MRRLPVQTAKLSLRLSKKNSRPSPATRIELGRVVNTHGVRGEVRFLPHSSPCPTLRPGLRVTLRKTDAPEEGFELKQVRPHASCLLLKFAGVDSRDRAEALRGSSLFADESDLPQLQVGEFYHYQVIGLPIRTLTQESIGTIAEVLTTPGHDVFVVRDGTKEYLIPVVEDVIRTIALKDRQVIIDPPEGLLENE